MKYSYQNNVNRFVFALFLLEAKMVHESDGCASREKGGTSTNCGSSMINPQNVQKPYNSTCVAWKLHLL